MKRIIISAIFILAISGFVFAQTPRAVIDKIKEIRPLESSRENVREILKDYELDDDDDEEHYQEFSNDDADIEVRYSNGRCEKNSDDEKDYDDVAEIWNVGEWKVTKVEIRLDESIKIEDAGYDLSEFKKEKNEAFADRYIYHSKNTGIAFVVDEGETDEIILFPPKGSYSMLCDNEKAKKFYSSDTWFGTKELSSQEIREYSANVNSITLSETEIIAGCNKKKQNRSCADSVKEISVTVEANDLENDVLTFNYTVSGGRIIGEGAKVIWDLAGVEPGIYTITAGVDDGCGVCGTTKTEKIVVKKCPDCNQNNTTHFSSKPFIKPKTGAN
ncbi:MAG TPA: hypothetical protein VGC76_19150 [Pyrinomonadaceae bacterium]|jgi:hypothetical protein